MPGSMEREVTAHDYKALFEDNPHGVIVLEALVRRFSKPAKLEGGIDAVIQTYHRMGEQAVVQFILAQINRANGVSELQGEPDETA